MLSVRGFIDLVYYQIKKYIQIGPLINNYIFNFINEHFFIWSDMSSLI